MNLPIWRKYKRSSVNYFILAIIFLGLSSKTMAQSVSDLDRQFVEQTLAAMPTSATAQGLHTYDGKNLDDELEDYSPGTLRANAALYRRFLADVRQAIANRHLSSEDRADLDVIRLQSEYSLLEIEDIQAYRHNPTMYVETVGNALYEPSVLDYAPKETRFRSIIERLKKVPAFVRTAEQNLLSSPSIWVRVASEENEGDIDLIDHQLRSEAPLDLTDAYRAAAAPALASLREFQTFLSGTLSRRVCDWRLGSRLYSEKFKLILATGDTPQQTLKDAEAKLQSIREDMRDQAAKVFPKYFPGEAPPSDLNTLVSRVLDKIAQQHTTPENYLSEAKRDLADATRFVEQKRLLVLPNAKNLQVIPTPEFIRGIYAVGGFAPAPALQPELGAFYWVTPFSPGMSAARVESKLREYDRWGLEILTIHEAMPGHYVQAEYADKVQPHWRGVLRQVYGNGPYVEGWAVYATQVMIDQGFDRSPEMNLTFGKQLLRVVANTILDVRLQTMGMTDEQAMDLMIRTFQEKEEAEKKLQRAKLSSCQLPTYFVGWRDWDKLRSADEAKQGSRFQLSRFHERALKEGALPMPVLQSFFVQ